MLGDQHWNSFNLLMKRQRSLSHISLPLW